MRLGKTYGDQIEVLSGLQAGERVLRRRVTRRAGRCASPRATTQSDARRGFTAKIVEVFITSKLSLLFLIASLLAGALALLATPREEDPQIVVPFADVFVEFPGASAEETENLVATPLEEKLWEIDGVEYVYSMSRPGEAVVTVRFYVGEDRERSLVKVWNKVMSNQDAVPSGVTGWIVKPVEIDDVPILLFTLSSPDPATAARSCGVLPMKCSTSWRASRIPGRAG